MIRTFVITVLCGLAASPAAVAIPDPTALGASIDKATPKKANERLLLYRRANKKIFGNRRGTLPSVSDGYALASSIS
jgi:hypothetical protein